MFSQQTDHEGTTMRESTAETLDKDDDACGMR